MEQSDFSDLLDEMAFIKGALIGVCAKNLQKEYESTFLKYDTLYQGLQSVKNLQNSSIILSSKPYFIRHEKQGS